MEAVTKFLSTIASATEFWAAVAGAVVGGFIAYVIQTKALREARTQRTEDRKRTQEALGHALLFKMVRIHSDFVGIHRHFEECFEEAAQKGLEGEPWQFYMPLANLPEPVHFQSDEMGMLLSLKNDDVFNSVLSMDVIHNSLIDGVRFLNAERRTLTQSLTPREVEGRIVAGVAGKEQMLAVRPRMIEVNMLTTHLRETSKNNVEESWKVLDGLQKTLRSKLGLAYKFQSNAVPRIP